MAAPEVEVEAQKAVEAEAQKEAEVQEVPWASLLQVQNGLGLLVVEVDLKVQMQAVMVPWALWTFPSPSAEHQLSRCREWRKYLDACLLNERCFLLSHRLMPVCFP